MLRPHLTAPRRAALAAALLLAAACQDAPTTPARDGPQAPIEIRAELAGTGVQALSVQVSGPAIATPIVVNVPVGTNAATANATLSLPVGGQRTLLVRGFDGDGVQTHEGLATVTVQPTANAPVVVRLYPKVGDVPITIGGAAYAIVITPATLPAASVGDTRQLAALVGDASGLPVAGAAVTWGSLNPVVASVDANGLVTARTVGTTTLYASWGGAAASIDLTVLGPPLVFREIAAGAYSTCALDDTGVAWCWGYDLDGLLGGGSASYSHVPRPTRVAGGLHFASISVGVEHACAVTITGQGYCWGNNRGQLGIGPPAATDYARPEPTLVAGGLTWASISAGELRTCGVTTAGAKYCWGADQYGELGLNPAGADFLIFPTPTQVQAEGGPWASVDVGFVRTCGLTTRSAVSCTTPVPRGSSQSFVVDPPGTDWRAVYVNDITVPSGFPGSFSVFGVTLSTACGLSAGGSVRCWGAAARGAAGSGGVDDVAMPTPVVGTQGYEELSMGGQFACGLRARAALCWGRNDGSQLGDGTTTDRLVPTLVSGGGSYVRIAAGTAHACALRGDGAAFCWGDNRFGQLGDGTTTTRTTPTLVARPLVP